MNPRVLGALLILSACIAAAAGRVQEHRRRLRMTESLANALDQMAGDIRFRRVPLPEALREVGKLPECGKYFVEIEKRVESNITLQEAWKQSISEIEYPTVREILLQMALSGDEERLLGNLTRARERLRADAAEERQKSAARNRLLWTGALSAGGLLTILLL